MKNLYLIRHAKSDWSGESESDFKRGLNKRGQKAISTMADALKERKVMPDLILCSAAKRTELTAKGLAKELHYCGKIQCMDALYMANPMKVLEIIKEINDKYDNVFIVGHNPETAELADLITDGQITDVPTLGIVALNIPLKHWKNFKLEKAKFNFFIYPKLFK